MKRKKQYNMKGGIWIAGFMLLSLLMVFAVKDLANKNLREVLINISPTADGSHLIDREDVLIQIERAFGHRLARRPIKSINIHSLEVALQESPFIDEAEVFIDSKNKIHLDIEQRDPILRMMPDAGEGYYLDAKGNRIPLTGQASPRVMIVTGNAPDYHATFLQREEDPLKDLFQLALTIHNDELLKPLIEQLHIDGDAEIMLIPKIGNQKIIFGEADNVADKMERLKIFYLKGLPVEGWTKYKTINLTFDGQVVCGKA